jgi:hypothetical protein
MRDRSNHQFCEIDSFSVNRIQNTKKLEHIAIQFISFLSKNYVKTNFKTTFGFCACLVETRRLMLKIFHIILI